MKKMAFSVILSLALCFFICGCGEKSPIAQGTYIAEVDVDDGAIKPTVTFVMSDKTFTFFYDPFSSYLGYGEYEIKGDRIIADTDDGKYTYIFEIIDNETVAFVEDGSSEIIMTSGDATVVDGTKFVCN